MLFVLPFGKISAGNFIYKAGTIVAAILYSLIGIWHREIYEAPHDKNKQYVFVANHTSYIDIPAIVRCMHQPIRALGKQEMVNYPVFGLIYRAAVICVDRSDAAHRAKSVKILKVAIKKGISVFIFPEGTFNETGQPLKDFYEGAFRIAIETKTPIKPVLFLDNIDRMHWRSIFSLSPGKNRVVFLDEIKVNAYVSSGNITALKQKVYDVMDAGLRRYKNYENIA